MLFFPRADAGAGGVEQALVVLLADGETGFGGQLRKNRFPELEHTHGARVVRLSYDVRAEEETVGKAVEEGSGLLLDLGGGDRIFRELIPRNVEIQMRECRILE